MSFLRADGKAALSRAIVAFEARTAAELVIVIEPRAGHYLHVPLAFASLAALAALAFLLYGEPSFALHWFLIDPVVLGLAVGWLASSWGPLERLVTPKKLRERWTLRAARAAFTARSCADTRGRTGVLLYVSLVERVAVVIADLGVRDAIPAKAWDPAVAAITDAVAREKYNRARFAEIVGRSYPRANAEDLELLTMVWGWIWVFDDHVCGDGPIGPGLTAAMPLLPPLCNILELPELSTQSTSDTDPGARSPLVMGFAELCQRLMARGGAEGFSRFREAMLSLLVGIVWEVDHRRTSTLPNVAQLLPMRRYGSAAAVAIALIEIGGDFVLPAAAFERTEVRRLRRQMANILCWINDIVSYAREASEQAGLLISLPRLLADHEGLSTQQALDQVAELYNTELGSYLELEAQLSRDASPPLRAFLTGMRSLIRGAYDWHLKTARYAVGTYFV